MKLDDIRRLGRLTEHFSWLEVFSSDTADRLGIDNVPADAELVAAMPRVIVAAWFLEEVRANMGGSPMGVNSWFRTPELNAHIPRASKTSHHLLGVAIDATHRSGPVATVKSARGRALALGWGYELIVYPSFAHVAALPHSPNVRKCLRLHEGALIPFEAASVRS